jgi:hypothetical protein
VESDPCSDPLRWWMIEKSRSFRRLSITRPDPTPARSPTPPDLRRSGSYSVPSASASRKRGEIVESERLQVSSPALPSDRAEVSPNIRVLMFASAAGGEALKQDDTGHWGAWGCRVGSHHPRPPSCRAHSFSVRRVSSSWREFPASVISTRTSRGSDSNALRKPDASQVDR